MCVNAGNMTHDMLTLEQVKTEIIIFLFQVPVSVQVWAVTEPIDNSVNVLLHR